MDYSVDRQRILHEQENFAELTSNSIETNIINKIELISEILVQNWVDEDTKEEILLQDRFYEIAPIFYNFYSGYQAINWINTSGHIIWSYPIEENREVINQSIVYLKSGDFNTAFDKARKTGSICVSDYIQLYQGNFGIVVYIPVFFNEELLGYFNISIDLDPLLDDIINTQDYLNEYRILLTNNESIIYESKSKLNVTDSPYVQVKNVDIYSNHWDLKVDLSSQLLQEISLWRNSYILIIGVFFAIFAGFSTQLLIRQNDLQKERFEENKKYQQLMNRYEKMNALGTMAGGLAHDFNNLLMSIQGNIEVLNLEIGEEGPVEIRNTISNIESIIEKSKDLTQQILIFSRHSEFESENLDIINVLDDTLKVVESAKTQPVEIKKNFNHTVSKTTLNYSRLSQCFLNILNNALDAIDGIGSIDINTSTVKYEHQLPDTLKPLIQRSEIKNYFVIEFIDTGKGIEIDNVEKIFEPFYTTKEMGKGTGLGLSISYQYISSIGGEIEVKSKLDIGTKFVIYLPIREQETLEDSAEPIQEKLPPEDFSLFSERFGQHPKVLLIEDEVEIAMSLQKILEVFDIEVNVSHNGSEALSIYNQAQDFDLIIADINLPGMSGIELVENIRKQDQDVPVLFITGFNEANIPKHKITNFEILSKPFNQQEFLQAVSTQISNSMD